MLSALFAVVLALTARDVTVDWGDCAAHKGLPLRAPKEIVAKERVVLDVRRCRTEVECPAVPVLTSTTTAKRVIQTCRMQTFRLRLFGARTGEGQSLEYGFPGPTIRVRPGEALSIRVTNHLPVLLDDDAGGLNTIRLQDAELVEIRPTGSPDPKKAGVAVGGFTYSMPPRAEGTYRYAAAKPVQLDDGMAGAVIVGDDDGRVLVIQRVHGSPPLVNGQLVPVIEMRAGETQRWRVINATDVHALVAPRSAGEVTYRAPDAEGWYTLPYDDVTPLATLHVSR